MHADWVHGRCWRAVKGHLGRRSIHCAGQAHAAGACMGHGPGRVHGDLKAHALADPTRAAQRAITLRFILVAQKLSSYCTWTCGRFAHRTLYSTQTGPALVSCKGASLQAAVGCGVTHTPRCSRVVLAAAGRPATLQPNVKPHTYPSKPAMQSSVPPAGLPCAARS